MKLILKTIQTFISRYIIDEGITRKSKVKFFDNGLVRIFIGLWLTSWKLYFYHFSIIWEGIVTLAPSLFLQVHMLNLP
jgi:hypothetical protein